MNLELKEKIINLKKARNAIILAHYYQRPEIQEIADAVGDSYYLSKVGREASEKVVLFCGVRFMAESAKILSPEKTVLLPVYNAGCPMAEMASEEELIKLKEKHPNAAIVCYINSTAEIKSLSDVCITSSNALKIIKNIDKEEIIFLPDKNLGEFIESQLPEKKFIIWQGFCITHRRVNREDILTMKEYKSGIKVLVHPECEKAVREIANFVGSTGEIIEFASKDKDQSYIVVTEEGILYELQKRNPHKNFYFPQAGMTCVNMKKTRLIDVYNSLLNLDYEINIDEKLREKASKALINMHQMAR